MIKLRYPECKIQLEIEGWEVGKRVTYSGALECGVKPELCPKRKRKGMLAKKCFKVVENAD